VRTVVVTGGTGALGRAVVPALRQAAYHVRVVSRSPGTIPEADRRGTQAAPTDHAVADLVTGTGVDEALSGAEVVVHLATTNGRRDVPMMTTLLQAAARQGVDHVVYVSIVGADRIPLPYYRHKVAAEELAVASGLPVTVQRSTQFHCLADRLFTAQRRLPTLLVPAIPLQPIDTRDVAARLLTLVAAPAGRAPDIGGPQVLPTAELARLWLAARGRHRPIVPLRLPGRVFASYSAGHHLVSGPPYGRLTFDEYLTHPCE